MVGGGGHSSLINITGSGNCTARKKNPQTNTVYKFQVLSFLFNACKYNLTPYVHQTLVWTKSVVLKKKIQWRKKNEIIYKQTVNIRQFSNSLWSNCFLIFLYNQYNNQYNCYKTPDYTGISKVITCTTFSLVGSDTIFFQVFYLRDMR